MDLTFFLANLFSQILYSSIYYIFIIVVFNSIFLFMKYNITNTPFWCLPRNIYHFWNNVFLVSLSQRDPYNVLLTKYVCPFSCMIFSLILGYVNLSSYALYFLGYYIFPNIYTTHIHMSTHIS